MSFSRELARQQIRFESRRNKQSFIVTLFTIAFLCFLLKKIL
jgi:hypothetical protein